MPASGSSMAVAAFNRMTLLTNSPNSRSRKRHSVTLISPLLSLLKGREADWTDFQLPFHCANNGCTPLPLSLSLSLSPKAPPASFFGVYVHQDPRPSVLVLHEVCPDVLLKVGRRSNIHPLTHSFISSFLRTVQISLPFSANDARTVRDLTCYTITSAVRPSVRGKKQATTVSFVLLLCRVGVEILMFGQYLCILGLTAPNLCQSTLMGIPKDGV